MKLAMVINDIEKENPKYTTMLVALAAHRAEHEVYIIDAEALEQDSSGHLCARARRAAPGGYESNEAYHEALKATQIDHILVDELDVLWLRNDPADDMDTRPWVSTAAILFGQLAVRRGLIVLNDPYRLSNALNKTYFQHVPEPARPRTMISRDAEAIRRFIREDLGGDGVIKPLQGSGGRNVFIVRGGDQANLNQMLEAVSRDGYVVAQEYLPKAAEGDLRLFVMNGEPLRDERGIPALMRRANEGGDSRSNMHVGGKPERCELTDEVLALAEIVRPMLVKDGMFFVGLDIVGDKLMEVNVFSPGGLTSCEELYDTHFTAPILAALERKVAHRHHYGGDIDNVEYATL